MLSGKVMIIHLTVGFIKDILLYKMSNFAEPYNRTKSKIRFKLDLYNYTKKYDIKNTKGVDTSKFAEEIGLANLKSDIDELDIDKLKTTPFDSSKLSEEVNNEAFKKDVYDKLVKKS